MCYREDWFYGWTQDDAARRRARSRLAEQKRETPPARTEPRTEAPRAPTRRETEAEEIV